MKKQFNLILIILEIIFISDILLELCGISIIIGELLLFPLCCISAVIIALILFLKSKNNHILIFTIIISCFLMFWSQFNVGSKRRFTKILSENNKNAVLVMEYKRPINAGVNFYKKVFPCIYIREKKDSLQTGYYPFSDDDVIVNWNDNNSRVEIKYKRTSESREYLKVCVSFD